MEEFLRNICADCSEEQRENCKRAKKGCDAYYKFLDEIVTAVRSLPKEDNTK